MRFEVYRKKLPSGTPVNIGSEDWVDGTTSYSYVDNLVDITSGPTSWTARYWITTVWNEAGLDMESGKSNTKDKNVAWFLPKQAVITVRKEVISSAYPNPFNPTTTISYDLPTSGQVELKVLDLFGREIAVLKEGNESSGRHYVRWNGRNSYGNSVASGMYFYQLIFQGERKVGKLLLMR